MADPRDTEVIQPYQGNVYAGHLSTPISDSGVVRTFVNNLPAYRKGISSLQRGLEVGAAHGYFLVGPWVLLGPLRDSGESANLGGLLAGIGLVLISTIALTAYGLVAFPKDGSEAAYIKDDQRTPADMKTGSGWSQYTVGFFIGAMGGAFVAYFLLDNFSGVDAAFRGLIN